MKPGFGQPELCVFPVGETKGGGGAPPREYGCPGPPFPSALGPGWVFFDTGPFRPLDEIAHETLLIVGTPLKKKNNGRPWAKVRGADPDHRPPQKTLPPPKAIKQSAPILGPRLVVQRECPLPLQRCPLAQ